MFHVSCLHALICNAKVAILVEAHLSSSLAYVALLDCRLDGVVLPEVQPVEGELPH